MALEYVLYQLRHIDSAVDDNVREGGQRLRHVALGRVVIDIGAARLGDPRGATRGKPLLTNSFGSRHEYESEGHWFY